MGLLSESISRSKSRSKSDAGQNDAGRPAAGGAAMHESASQGGAGAAGEDTMNLDKDQGNVLMSIIQQRGCQSISTHKRYRGVSPSPSEASSKDYSGVIRKGFRAIHADWT